ncbi:MAG: MATE family efflux transporter [Clostridiales bacterium]|nr:MATE family efflux transporter [Clostridiales bacterium]
MKDERKSLTQLFVPICFETLCYMLAGMVDTLMLSSVNDQAVGAVGTANTYIGVFIIMFSVVSSGMIAVMTQYIGAGRNGVAYQAKQLGLVFSAILGIVLSFFLFFCAEPVLKVVGVADLLLNYAVTYMKIVGGSCILNALIPIFSSYLRAFGYTKEPLIATLTGNVLNFILNAVFLFVLDMGVTGVAIATVISRVVNLIIVIFAGMHLIHAGKEKDRLPNKVVLGQIIRVGLPSAMESALYNLAMTIIIRFLNQMDADGLNVTARSYAVQITNFSFSVGAALAQANAILTGWRIGAGEYDECDKGTKKAALIGIVVATLVETLFAVFSGVLMGFFTDDAVMIELVGKLMVIDIVLEMGRVSNLVFGNALKTSGDAVFTTVIAAIFMYACAVGGTYILGIRLGMLVIGAYIGMALDECARAVCMFLRWRSGKWREKELIQKS